MSGKDLVGEVVRAETMQDEESFRGEVVGYQGAPTVVVVDEDGERHHWRADMVERLDREQERLYWKARLHRSAEGGSDEVWVPCLCGPGTFSSAPPECHYSDCPRSEDGGTSEDEPGLPSSRAQEQKLLAIDHATILRGIAAAIERDTLGEEVGPRSAQLSLRQAAYALDCLRPPNLTTISIRAHRFVLKQIVRAHMSGRRKDADMWIERANCWMDGRDYTGAYTSMAAEKIREEFGTIDFLKGVLDPSIANEELDRPDEAGT